MGQCSLGPRGNGHYVKHRRIHLNVRKHFFNVREMEHWHRLRGEVVESPCVHTQESSGHGPKQSALVVGSA